MAPGSIPEILLSEQRVGPHHLYDAWTGWSQTWNTQGFIWTWKTQGKIVTNKVFLVHHSNIWSECGGDLLYCWSWCGMTLNECHLLHLLFVAITYRKVSVWLSKSLENSGIFSPTFWPPCKNFAGNMFFCVFCGIDQTSLTRQSCVLVASTSSSTSHFQMTSQELPSWKPTCESRQLLRHFTLNSFFFCFCVLYVTDAVAIVCVSIMCSAVSVHCKTFKAFMPLLAWQDVRMACKKFFLQQFSKITFGKPVDLK